MVVTFLRMDRAPDVPALGFPDGYTVRRLTECSVAQYRWLYNTVGNDYLWWLRRTISDSALAAILSAPSTIIHLLYHKDTVAGFHELDVANWPGVNVNYFGLMPDYVGAGVGAPFLRHAVDSAWQAGAAAITVNTCTADHPRALPTYQRAGFGVVRRVTEVWDVPDRLGLIVPPALRA